ncbi:serine hydrolase domain-containing protein [Nocardiopsis trehalosi]|uniref:serine hydrolase domain-containing protein n=1 Tax=Nocardiopsis trehalosi TaxID=109329 RepID=UPI000AACBB03|nr:serine hydrolase domain-containing protein [Nocardiopsis trehalosi]
MHTIPRSPWDTGPERGARARGPRRAAAVLAAALALAVGAPVPPAAADPAGPAEPTAGAATAAEIDRFAAAYVADTGLPGATLAVVRDGEVVHTGGYGHDSAGAPLRADTPMRTASLSKSFTALAVLQLVEAGRVDLEAPVRDHLPEFAPDDPRADRITVRQLLDQSSGMADTAYPEATAPQPRSLEEAVAAIGGYPLAGAPGERWRYHNPNYHVAARLVEAVSGEPFADYLDRHVFGPAGMADTTSLTSADDPVPGLERGYVRAYGADVPLPEPHQFSAGSGGVVSTAADLARWLLVHTGDGRAPGGARLVTADSVAEMHTPSAPNGSYGLGWMEDVPEEGDPMPTLVWHGGVQSTATAYQVLVPETGVGVAALFNSGMTLTENDTWNLVEGVIALTEGRTPPEGGSTLWRVDAVFGVLTAAAAALGVRGVVRAPLWARRRAGRPVWRAVVRLLPGLVPAALLAAFPSAASFLMGGRVGSWAQRFYAIPAELVFLWLAAAAGVAVVAVRTAHLVRARRGSGAGRRGTRAAGERTA